MGLYDELIKERHVPSKEQTTDFVARCTDKENSRLYGTLDQRIALNITQFWEIQGSMAWRAAMVYPFVKEESTFNITPENLAAIASSAATSYALVYAPYLLDTVLGFSKYTIEGLRYAKNRVLGRETVSA